MDKWLKDILPDKDPCHNRGRDQMRKKGGPEFECLWFWAVVTCYVWLMKWVLSRGSMLCLANEVGSEQG